MACGDEINAGIHKRVFTASLAAVFCLAGFPSSASSKSRYTIQEMLGSSLEEPAYKYKFAACLFIDAELIVRTGAKFKSLFISEKNFPLMVSGYMSKYNIDSKKKFDDFMFNDESQLIVDEHFRKAFKTEAGIDSVKNLCKETMMAYVRKDTANSATSTTPRTTEERGNQVKHEKCLEAKDYEGCMKYQTNGPHQKVSIESKDKCFDGWGCFAMSDEPDRFGFPKLKGWFYTYNPEWNNLSYLDVTASKDYKSYKLNWYKVKVRGEYGRYISSRQIFRRTRPGRAATAGYSTSTGGTHTDCTGYDTGIGVNMNCTTTGPTVINIPGTAGRPTQNVSETLHSIVDCKDLTFVKRWISSSPRNDAKEGKWKKVSPGRDDIKKACLDVNSLPMSSYRGYE